MRNDHFLVCWRIVKVHRIIKIVFLIIRIDFIAVNLRACAKCVSFPSHISIFVHLQSTLDGLLLKHVAIHSVAFKKTLSETRCEVRKQENVCNDSEGNVFIKISYFIEIADNYFSQCFLRKKEKSNLTRQFVHFIARSHDVLYHLTSKMIKWENIFMRWEKCLLKWFFHRTRMFSS